MSGRQLRDSVRRNDEEEALRLIDEEDVAINERDEVSFYLSHVQ